MRITLVINPFASAVDSRRRVVIQRLLAESHDLTVIETTKGGHAVRLAYGAHRKGADLVVSLGGDGTINEVVNGLLGTGARVAPLPGGSTNVFARSIGYPNDPVEATATLLAAIEAGSSVSAGVGLGGDRAFLFNLGVGFDAAVVGRVERRGAIKRWAGHPFFVGSAAATWLNDVDHDHPWFTVTAGGVEASAQFAIALNTDPYTYLGNRPLTVAPEAGLDQPLSIVGLRSLRLGRALPTVAGALRSDQGVADGPNAFHWSGLERATVTGHRAFPYQLDGEFFEPVDALTITYEADAIEVMVPVS